MSGVAILCSGQGGQHREMFRLFDGFAEGEGLFGQAAGLLAGTDPRRFVSECDEAALFANRAGQVLCCVEAMLAWAAIRDVVPGRATVAGYSVGELAAWGCTGRLSAEQVVRLAGERAAAMDDAAPDGSGLAAIAGVGRAALEAMLADAAVEIAIVNGAESFVVGGTEAGLRACLDAAKAAGATTTRRLRVSVPAHTRAMRAAAERFEAALRGGTVAAGGGARLISGIDGARVRDAGAGLEKLAAGIARPIRWADCLVACREAGADRFLELGPGRALARMAAAGGAEARSIEDFRTLTGIRDWIARRG